MLAQGRLAYARHGFDLTDGMGAIQQGGQDHEALWLGEQAQPFGKISAFFEGEKSHGRGFFG